MKLSSSRAIAGVALTAALVLLYGWRLGARSFWEPDEPRYAEIAREMLVSGDWVTPRLDALRYYEKPPLIYWTAASSFAVFGTSEGSARLGAVLFSLLFLAGTWTLARTLFGTRTALLSTLVLALAPLSWISGRFLVPDMFLAGGVVWVLAGYALALDRRRRGLSTVFPMTIAGAAAAIALLAKGPIGIVLPALGIVPHRWLAGRAAAIGPRGWAAAAAVAAILGLPWFAAISWRDPSFVEFFLWHEHVLRFATHTAHHEGPPWYYLGILAAGLFPSSFLVPWAFARCRPRLRRAGLETREQATWLLLLFGGGALAFFTVSQSKLPGYILPALPAPAILVGRALSEVLEWRPARGLRISLILSAIGSWATSGTLLWFSIHPPDFVPGGTDIGALLPAVVLIAVLFVLLGVALAGAAAAARPRGLHLGLAASAAVLFLLLPSFEFGAERLDPSLSLKSLALRAARLAGPSDMVASYGGVLQGLTFYTGRRTLIVGGAGELEFGERTGEGQGWIVGSKNLPGLLEGTTVYMVASKGMARRACNQPGGSLRVLESTPSYTLLTNARSAAAAGREVGAPAVVDPRGPAPSGSSR